MEEIYLSEKQHDFIREIANIGAGNALTALGQLLKCDMDMKAPVIHVFEPQRVSTVFGDPSMAAVSVVMCMAGDVKGEIFLIFPDQCMDALASVVEQSMLELKERFDTSVLAGIGNAVVDAYLSAVHDFCGLNISHTDPVIRYDMRQALLDESAITLAREAGKIILVENEFLANTKQIKIYMLAIPSPASVWALTDSIEAARVAYEKD